jgi:UrcA family protein
MLKILGPTLAIALSGSAFAQSASLDLKGLDLNSEAGKVELDRRVNVAARRACPADAMTGSRIPPIQQREACMADVRKQVYARLAAKGRLVIASPTPAPAPQP